MYDCIICLGKNLSEEGFAGVLQSRLSKTAHLYHDHLAKKIILTGGYYGRKDLSEADYMLNVLLDLGIPKKDILLEKKSIDTIENAKFSFGLMKKHKFKSAIVITSPSHLKRTEYIFRRVIGGRLDFVASEEELGRVKKIITWIKERFALLKLFVKFN